MSLYCPRNGPVPPCIFMCLWIGQRIVYDSTIDEVQSQLRADTDIGATCMTLTSSWCLLSSVGSHQSKLRYISSRWAAVNRDCDIYINDWILSCEVRPAFCYTWPGDRNTARLLYYFRPLSADYICTLRRVELPALTEKNAPILWFLQLTGDKNIATCERWDDIAVLVGRAWIDYTASEARFGVQTLRPHFFCDVYEMAPFCSTNHAASEAVCGKIDVVRAARVFCVF